MINQLKRLLSQSAIYGIGALVSPIISFIMLPIYTRYLTPSDYGILTLTGIVSMILSSCIGMGINSGIVRIFFLYDEKTDRNAVITSSVLFSFLTSIVIVLLLFPFSGLLSGIVFDFPKGEVYFKLVLITVIFNIAVANMLSVLRSEERSKIYTASNVLALIITLTLNIVFVMFLKRGVRGILEAHLLSAVINVFMVFPFALGRKKLDFSAAKLRQVLAFGLPLVPSIMSDIIMSLSDRYFLEHYSTLSEVGLYSLGYRIASILVILIIKPFNIAWAPYMFSVAREENAKEVYKTVLVYYTYITTWIGLGISLFAREGLLIIATPQYLGASSVVPLVVLGYLLYGMGAVLVAGLHITQKTKYIGYLFIVSAGINILLNFLIIPGWGMMGAATATLLTYLVMNISYFIIAQKFYPIDHEFSRIMKVLITGVGLYVVCLLFITDNVYINIIIKMLLWISLPVLLVILKFYKKNEITRIRGLVLKLKPSNGLP